MRTYEQYLRNRENRLRNFNQENCTCNVAVPPNEGCCYWSDLRDPGIKRIRDGVYYADANLQCGSGCRGFDTDTIYEWDLIAITGNPSIAGDRRRVGNDRVEVAGSGRFLLSVRVTFRCRSGDSFIDCLRQTGEVFTQ
ncbi:hypothetical protein BIV60_19995 [Bacillus sp. MUM 116]|uniref:hypothetical protein n=1 Tax=Bacillus sp. MUM 116 TaxID=1678002 RepID=UPI0008F59D77|nr:hypothetical protein [Bacillus sp. MUM 116]OIK10756.1 hypothetical protein BIV60_19995 [Bacillus sp. MUM 116]